MAAPTNARVCGSLNQDGDRSPTKGGREPEHSGGRRDGALTAAPHAAAAVFAPGWDGGGGGAARRRRGWCLRGRRWRGRRGWWWRGQWGRQQRVSPNDGRVQRDKAHRRQRSRGMERHGRGVVQHHLRIPEGRVDTVPINYIIIIINNCHQYDIANYTIRITYCHYT